MRLRVLESSILVILVLWLKQGSSLPIDALDGQEDEATVRQMKSEEMLKYMNTSADPCDNFYEYSCGNYAKYNPTSPELNAVGTFETLAAIMHNRIKSELQSSAAEKDSEASTKLKNFYKSCLNVQELDVESDFRDQLKSVIGEFGEMPALEGDMWWESDFDWSKTVGQMMHKTGKPLIFSISILPDYTNVSTHRVVIKEPLLAGGGRDFYAGEEFRAARESRTHVISSYLQVFLGVEEALANETAQEMLDFEVALAQGLRDEKKGQQPIELFFLTDMDEVQSEYLDEWDTETLISDALGGDSVSEVYVQTEYLEAVREALANTPKRAVANYIFYTYLSDFMYQTGESASQREEYCVALTKSHFYKYFENFMYHKYELHKAEPSVYSMWRELKTSLRDTLYLPRLDWMQEYTKALLIEKLKQAQLKILSYDHYDFAEEFAQLELNDDDYIANINAILSLRGQQARAKWEMPPQAEEMGVQSTSIAYYDPAENKIFLPVAYIMPYYIWSSSYPYAYNFAQLGFIIAHELMHGFDAIGRHHDAHGNNRMFWDSRSNTEFMERSQCFVGQYKQYKYKGQYLPEMEAQGENIADCSAVRLAYTAYMKWSKKAEAKVGQMAMESLPDLEYSLKQLFFISYGQMWCSNYDAAVVASQLADVHTPNELRDIGPLANFDEFSKQFNCSVGSAMNPATKCIIY